MPFAQTKQLIMFDVEISRNIVIELCTYQWFAQDGVGGGQPTEI